MATSGALISTLAGSGIATLGIWLGTHLQTREGRRVRYEQYNRDDRVRYEQYKRGDRLRDLDIRRDLYARFALVSDEAIDYWINAQSAGIRGDHDSSLASLKLCLGKQQELDRLRWLLEFVGCSPEVAAAAEDIRDSFANMSLADDGDLAAQIALGGFVRIARENLGLERTGKLEL